MTNEEKQMIMEKAISSFIFVLNVHKIDYFSLPKELRDAIRDIYILGCENTITYLKEK